MDGILLVDKPKGWTSFDAVAKVRGILKSSGIKSPKVGHTGTLDPLATGLLVLLIGNYTKKASEFSKLAKTYEARLKLGETSITGDEEGEKTQISTHRPSLGEVKTTVEQFVGEITQTPPAFSAIKISGQRAYKLARQGKVVKLEPRKVNIYSITDVKYDYPSLKFTCKVSSGTYIRTLAQDIGQKLKTGAYLTNLRRTKIGNFVMQDAIGFKSISAETINDQLQHTNK